MQAKLFVSYQLDYVLFATGLAHPSVESEQKSLIAFFCLTGGEFPGKRSPVLVGIHPQDSGQGKLLRIGSVCCIHEEGLAVAFHSSSDAGCKAEGNYERCPVCGVPVELGLGAMVLHLGMVGSSFDGLCKGEDQLVLGRKPVEPSLGTQLGILVEHPLNVYAPSLDIVDILLIEVEVPRWVCGKEGIQCLVFGGQLVLYPEFLDEAVLILLYNGSRGDAQP